MSEIWVVVEDPKAFDAWSARIRWGINYCPSSAREWRVTLFGPKYTATRYVRRQIVSPER